MQRADPAPKVTPEVDGKVYLSTLGKAYVHLMKLYEALRIKDNDKIDWIESRVAEQRKRFGVRTDSPTP